MIEAPQLEDKINSLPRELVGSDILPISYHDPETINKTSVFSNLIIRMKAALSGKRVDKNIDPVDAVNKANAALIEQEARRIAIPGRITVKTDWNAKLNTYSIDHRGKIREVAVVGIGIKLTIKEIRDQLALMTVPR